MPSPISRDHSVATLTEVQHLPVPVVRRERPAMAEHYGLALSPVLVVDLRSVFRRDCRHDIFSFGVI